MDPAAFGTFYPSPLATAIPPGMRYPFTPSPATSVGARGMVFYPQQLGVPDTPNQSSTQLSRCVSGATESFTVFVSVRIIDVESRNIIINI